jgi:hypothetical protein
LKFQKIHSDLIIETTDKNFVSEVDKGLIGTALQADKNLSDLTNNVDDIRNLGLEQLLASFTEMAVVNDRVKIINGAITLSRLPLGGTIIFNMCYILTQNNLIIAEEYDALYIDGLVATFTNFDPEYEGLDCLLSYVSI